MYPHKMPELDVINAVWAHRELKKKKGEKMGTQLIIRDRRSSVLFWTIFEDMTKEKGEIF